MEYSSGLVLGRELRGKDRAKRPEKKIKAKLAIKGKRLNCPFICHLCHFVNIKKNNIQKFYSTSTHAWLWETKIPPFQRGTKAEDGVDAVVSEGAAFLSKRPLAHFFHY